MSPNPSVFVRVPNVHVLSLGFFFRGKASFSTKLYSAPSLFTSLPYRLKPQRLRDLDEPVEIRIVLLVRNCEWTMAEKMMTILKLTKLILTVHSWGILPRQDLRQESQRKRPKIDRNFDIGLSLLCWLESHCCNFDKHSNLLNFWWNSWWWSWRGEMIFLGAGTLVVWWKSPRRNM